MKTKIALSCALAILCANANAQNTFPNNGNVGVGTLSPATSLQVIGTSRFGAAANYAQFDGSGNLNFTGSGNYKVSGNRYAFQYSGNPNYGLFFNSTNVRYEFRDGSAAPVFYVNANTGAGTFLSTLKVGAYTLPATDGANNQVLKTDGAGNLTWKADNTGSFSGWGLTGNSGTIAGTNFIGTTDNIAFTMRTNNSERVRITADGRLGIGTTTPTGRLHINSASGEDALRIQTNGSTRLFVDDAGGVSIGSTSPGPAGGLYVAGNIGIGNTAPVNKLDVVGNMGISGNITLTGTTPLLRVGTADGAKIQIGTVESFEDFGSSTFGSSSNIVPLTDNARDLGSSTFRWNEVWATDGTINTSDEREKQNIRDLGYGLKEIMQLRSVKFNWKNVASQDDKIGLIAQELKKVLPEVVRDYDYKVDEATGKREKVAATRLGVMYSDIIPVLIKGMQEQQKMIEDQQKQIEELVATVKNQKAVATSQSASMKATNIVASLEQNTPNPFNSITTIRYNVPTSVNKAQIIVTNTAGIAVKTFTVNGKGAGVVNINANELNAGSYFYTLIVDGKKADSKQMVLVR